MINLGYKFELPYSKAPILNRKDFINFLRQSYDERVHFLLLPEFYLPIQWISDVLAFVRRSGITVITGLQYVVANKVAHNNVAVFPAIKSGKHGNYMSSCMFVREKNDYAPMERCIWNHDRANCKSLWDRCRRTIGEHYTGVINM